MEQIRGGGDRFVAAVEAIYDAAAQPSNWPDALQMVAGVFDDVGANLIWARDDGSFGTIVSPELDLVKSLEQPCSAFHPSLRSIIIIAA